MNPNILVIGGGVIGLSIARELHKAGFRKTKVIERGVCGMESSWAAAGMLGPQAEADEGDAFFDFCCESRDLFPALADQLLEETAIDIELDRTGTLSLAFNEKDTDELLQRSRWQIEAGLKHETLSTKEVRQLEPLVSSRVQFGIYFPNDWQVENRKLLIALRRYADLNGIGISENTSVDALIIENGVAKGVETNIGPLTADITVLATGAWTSFIKFGDRSAPFEIKPVRGQMIEFRPSRPLFRHVIYSRLGYLVPRIDGRILAGSTSENVGYDKNVTESAARDLSDMANEISDAFAELEIVDHWSGLRPFSADGLPVLGPITGHDGLLIATAHYRNGILLAPLTAKMIAASMVNNNARSEMFDLYSPERFSRNRTVGL
ncbi:MAG TPA: glycine oxidase ThiO [Pyrinomonadaceae bacterium]|nr:glycine oxidase ThiO [Pyrinomonadaceae bacterium]